MDKELLSVPEFAKAAGVAKQGLYERARNENSKLFPYVVFQGSKIFIQRDALKEVYGIDPNSQESKENSKESKEESQEKQAESQGSQDGSQAAEQDKSQESQGESQAQEQAHSQGEQSIISFLTEQLREKDRQIAEKDKQIERIQQLLDQEQQLHLSTKMLLIEATKQEEPQEEKEASPAVPEVEERQEQEPPKRVSWWRRVFLGEE